MNAQLVNVEASIIDTKSNAARKPKLSTKLEKQMMFGCWFLQHLVEQGIIADSSVFSRARTALKMFESLEVQTEFYETFETAMSATQKVTRKEIADFHKPPKAPKASRAKKADAKTGEGEVAEPKRGRKKKVVEVVVDNNKDFIDQLVAVANARSAEQVAAIVAESTSKSNAEPEVTPIIPTTNILQVTVETTIDPVKEKKPRKKPEPKAKPVEPVITEVVITTEVTEPIKAAPKKRAAPKKKEAEVIAPIVAEVIVAEVIVKTAEPVIVKAAEPVIVKAAEPVIATVEVVAAEVTKAAKAPRKKPEPKAKVVDPKVEEARQAAELKAVEEARILVESRQLEEARQAAIKAAKEAVDDEDDDRSHHTVKLPDSDDEGDDEDQDEEEEEIHAREFIFNGKQYLIDDNSNEVYDYETQEPIGTFDKETNRIIGVYI